MLERSQVEKMMERAQRWDDPNVIASDALAELCRVYLAWLDAPESVWIDKFGDLQADYADIDKVRGKRVRLVEVKE